MLALSHTRDVVREIFEIREREGESITSFQSHRLADVHVSTPMLALLHLPPLKPMLQYRQEYAKCPRPGWMIQLGRRQTFGSVQRAQGRSSSSITAAELDSGTNIPGWCACQPMAVTGWELTRKQRAMFIEFFGSDLNRSAARPEGIPG